MISEIRQDLLVNIPHDVLIQACGLCNEGSDNQKVFERVISNAELTDDDYSYVMAYCVECDDVDQELQVVGWATVSDWLHGDTTYRAIQIAVAPEHRRKGLGTALFAVVSFGLPTSNPVPIAVFSEHCLRMARRLDYGAEQFKRDSSDEWYRVDAVVGRVEE